MRARDRDHAGQPPERPGRGWPRAPVLHLLAAMTSSSGRRWPQGRTALCALCLWTWHRHDLQAMCPGPHRGAWTPSGGGAALCGANLQEVDWLSPGQRPLCRCGRAVQPPGKSRGDTRQRPAPSVSGGLVSRLCLPWAGEADDSLRGSSEQGTAGSGFPGLLHGRGGAAWGSQWTVVRRAGQGGPSEATSLSVPAGGPGVHLRTCLFAFLAQQLRTLSGWGGRG